jgi:hypothetical protein
VEVDGGTFETCIYPDTAPPGIPANLVAEVGDGGVVLSWSQCSDSDLSGYFVYRTARGRTGDSEGGLPDGDYGRSVRLNELPLTTETFLDEDVQESTFYLYSVSAVDEAGNEGHPCDPVVAMVGPRDDGDVSALRMTIALNPCYGSTTIDYSSPAGSRPSVRIYSVGGRLVRELPSVPDEKGLGSVTWDCRDRVDRPVGTGVFVCELAAAGEVVRGKITVVR